MDPEGHFMRFVVNVFSAEPWGVGILDLARKLETVGFDEIDFGDHVTLGHATPARPVADPPPMALLEPLVTIGAVAAVTENIRLGTGVMVLPQRHPAVVAKQLASLDILSGGRIRAGVGVGWQEAEFESLNVPFAERGRRIDECIELVRLYWTQPEVTYEGRFYHAEAMAMEPKPVQPGGPPVWLGGRSDAALRRVGRLGDGWMAVAEPAQSVGEKVAKLREAAEQAGRDPKAIGLQTTFIDFSDYDALVAQAARFRAAGFDWFALDVTSLHGSGVVETEAHLDTLSRLKERIESEAA
jgi:probable F420-dependent oxidoreductase